MVQLPPSIMVNSISASLYNYCYINHYATLFGISQKSGVEPLDYSILYDQTYTDKEIKTATSISILYIYCFFFN